MQPRTLKRYPNKAKDVYKPNGDKFGGTKKEDQRVSVCSDCRKGIFKFQTYEWTNRGLVHTPCT